MDLLPILQMDLPNKLGIDRGTCILLVKMMFEDGKITKDAAGKSFLIRSVIAEEEKRETFEEKRKEEENMRIRSEREKENKRRKSEREEIRRNFEKYMGIEKENEEINTRLKI